MDRKLRITSKSFFYNLISHDYYVYKTDKYNEFLLVKLICDNCETRWGTGRQECFLCGTENYHVFTCINCDHKISITRSSTSTCPECEHNDTFKQLCINTDCITNQNPVLREKVINSGGVFAGNGGFSIRQMSCKNCGSSKNHYVSAECVIVQSKAELTFPFSIYIEREAEDMPVKSYWCQEKENIFEFKDINELIDFQLERSN